MLVNNRMKTAIANAFYDKAFTVAARGHDKDIEGGATTTVGAPVEHMGNVQYSLNARTRESIGITEQVDLAITTFADALVAKDDEIVFNGRKFVVTDVKPRDSHLLIICQKR